MYSACKGANIGDIMQKTLALELLGGSVAKVAEAIGINSQAVSQWPDVLPPRIADRVIAACTRKGIKVPKIALKTASEAA